MFLVYATRIGTESSLMTSVPELTIEVARRLERLIAPEPSDGDPQDPRVPKIVQFGQTVACRAKGGQPSNKVFCFSEADLGLLPEILDFYEAEALEPTFYLAPANFSGGVGLALAGKGFVQTQFEQTILYGAPSLEAPVLPQGMTIEAVTAGNLGEYARTMGGGFEWDDEWREAAVAHTQENFDFDSPAWLARVDGEAAGVASLRLADGGVGGIRGGAVLPRFRGRGIHYALVRHRMFFARQVGLELLIGGAAYGSTSFRNQLRAGMRLAYIESGWTRGMGDG